MRPGYANVQGTRRRRLIGAGLALVALLVQLTLPAAAARAMGLDGGYGLWPVCSAAGEFEGDAAGHGSATQGKVLHAACPLCQAPAMAWGYLPPTQPQTIAASDRRARVVRHHNAARGTASADPALYARGPPEAA
jgi:hypothetical protein